MLPEHEEKRLSSLAARLEYCAHAPGEVNNLQSTHTVLHTYKVSEFSPPPAARDLHCIVLSLDSRVSHPTPNYARVHFTPSLSASCPRLDLTWEESLPVRAQPRKLGASFWGYLLQRVSEILSCPDLAEEVKRSKRCPSTFIIHPATLHELHEADSIGSSGAMFRSNVLEGSGCVL